MYSIVKFVIKLNNMLNNDCFECSFGTPQRVCLSPIMFFMFVKDFESTFCEKGMHLDSYSVSHFICSADDTLIFENTAEELQENVYILEEYCNSLKFFKIPKIICF